MAITLPPVPIGEKENSYLWNQWYLKLSQILNSEEGIAWTLVDKTGSNLTDLATRTHNSLTTFNGGQSGEYYHMTSAQHTLAITLAAGQYTPTRSAEVNMDANVTTYEAQYLRVGATVTVSGSFLANPTAAGVTSFQITLPVASNIGAVSDAAGVAAGGGIAGMSAAISGVVASDTALVSWIAVDTTAQTWYYTFSYQVI